MQRKNNKKSPIKGIFIKNNMKKNETMYVLTTNNSK